MGGLSHPNPTIILVINLSGTLNREEMDFSLELEGFRGQLILVGFLGADPKRPPFSSLKLSLRKIPGPLEIHL